MNISSLKRQNDFLEIKYLYIHYKCSIFKNILQKLTVSDIILQEVMRDDFQCGVDVYILRR